MNRPSSIFSVVMGLSAGTFGHGKPRGNSILHAAVGFGQVGASGRVSPAHEQLPEVTKSHNVSALTATAEKAAIAAASTTHRMRANVDRAALPSTRGISRNIGADSRWLSVTVRSSLLMRPPSKV